MYTKIAEIQQAMPWVTAFAISPDNIHFAAAHRDNAIHVRELNDIRNARVFRGHQHAITYLVFSPDGRQLASGDLCGVVRLWNIITGLQEAVLEQVAYTGEVRHLSYIMAENFRKLLIISTNHREFQVPPCYPSGQDYESCDNGQRMTDNLIARFLNLGNLNVQPLDYLGEFTHFDIHEITKKIVFINIAEILTSGFVTGHNHRIEVRDLITGFSSHDSISVPPLKTGNTLTFSPNGRQFAMCSRSITLYDSQTLHQQAGIGINYATGYDSMLLQYRPDSHQLICFFSDTSYNSHYSRSGNPSTSSLENAYIIDPLLLAQGRTLLDRQSTNRPWKLPFKNWTSLGFGIYHPTNNQLVTTKNKDGLGEIIIWDSVTQTNLQTLQTGYLPTLLTKSNANIFLKFSSDGQRLLTLCNSGTFKSYVTIRLWDTHATLAALQKRLSPINQVSKDSNLSWSQPLPMRPSGERNIFTAHFQTAQIKSANPWGVNNCLIDALLQLMGCPEDQRQNECTQIRAELIQTNQTADRLVLGSEIPLSFAIRILSIYFERNPALGRVTTDYRVVGHYTSNGQLGLPESYGDGLTCLHLWNNGNHFEPIFAMTADWEQHPIYQALLENPIGVPVQQPLSPINQVSKDSSPSWSPLAEFVRVVVASDVKLQC